MKRKIFTLLMVMLCLVGITKAQSITLQPQGDGLFGKDCLIPVDVYLDTNGESIVTITVVTESDLSYVNFIPDNSFGINYLPVIEDGNKLRITGISDLSGPVVGSGKIGTIYYLGVDGSLTNEIKLLYNRDFYSILSSYTHIYEVEPMFVIVQMSEDIDSCSNGQDDLVLSGDKQSKEELLQQFNDKYMDDYNEFQSQRKNNNLKKYLIVFGIPVLLFIGLGVFLLLSYKKKQGKRY